MNNNKEAVYAMTIYHDCCGSPTIDVKLFKTKEAAKKKFIELLDETLDGGDAVEILGYTYDRCVNDLSFNDFGTYIVEVKKVFYEL